MYRVQTPCINDVTVFVLPDVVFFVLLLATGELGSALYSHSSPETSGGSDGPMTQHKKVRCFTENVKKGDDRNYEIEQIRKKVRDCRRSAS
jgi:hypothetical protein